MAIEISCESKDSLSLPNDPSTCGVRISFTLHFQGDIETVSPPDGGRLYRRHTRLPEARLSVGNRQERSARNICGEDNGERKRERKAISVQLLRRRDRVTGLYYSLIAECPDG